MAIARELTGSGFRPAGQFEDGPRERGWIGVIEGDCIETIGMQVLKPRLRIDENDPSP